MVQQLFVWQLNRHIRSQNNALRNIFPHWNAIRNIFTALFKNIWMHTKILLRHFSKIFGMQPEIVLQKYFKNIWNIFIRFAATQMPNCFCPRKTFKRGVNFQRSATFYKYNTHTIQIQCKMGCKIPTVHILLWKIGTQHSRHGKSLKGKKPKTLYRSFSG